jgi:allantoinase
MMMLWQVERYPYLPLHDRPLIRWPNGARVAFWVAPNIEFYELEPPSNQGRMIWPRPNPDILSYGQRDYGNRVGVWRVLEALDRFNIRASVPLNAAMIDHLPDVVEACLRQKWELMSHGVYNTRVISQMTEDEVRELIRDSIQTISAFSGSPVRGWLAPAISTTETFLDLLPEFGITYTIDIVPDDQPVPVFSKGGQLIAVPYSTEINDIRVMGFRGSPPSDWADMMKSAFDQLYLEGAENGMVVCMPLHPYVVGQPHRISALYDVLRHVTGHKDVWFATAREIAEWYYQHNYDHALKISAQQ